MAETLKPSDYYRHPDQPTMIYDIHKPWEEVVANPPIWLGSTPPAGGGIIAPHHVDQFKAAGGDAFFTGSACLANPLLAYERRLYEAGLF